MPNPTFYSKLALCAALSLSLTACETNSDGKMSFSGMNAGNSAGAIGEYCSEYKVACVFTGLLIVGGVVLVASSHNNNNSTAPVLISDARLKQDIRPLMTLDDGIRLYTYHYIHDDRVFVGAMAQDLLKDPRFSQAVSIGPGGYYEVDYNKLGLTVINARAMQDAGSQAASDAAKL